jgi:hypothetical protein
MKIAFNPALACIGMIGLLLTTAILAADGSVPPTLTNEHKAIDLRLEVNDLVFQVRDYPREGEAIVFLHYTGGNMMSWARAVPTGLCSSICADTGNPVRPTRVIIWTKWPVTYGA